LEVIAMLDWFFQIGKVLGEQFIKEQTAHF